MRLIIKAREERNVSMTEDLILKQMTPGTAITNTFRKETAGPRWDGRMECPGESIMMVELPGLKGMSSFLWAAATSCQLGMYRTVEVVERECLCKHTLWLIHGALATDMALEGEGKLLVFKALGDLQRNRQGDKAHLTIIEMCFYSGNGQRGSDHMESRSCSC